MMIDMKIQSLSRQRKKKNCRQLKLGATTISYNFIKSHSEDDNKLMLEKKIPINLTEAFMCSCAPREKRKLQFSSACITK